MGVSALLFCIQHYQAACHQRILRVIDCIFLTYFCSDGFTQIYLLLNWKNWLSFFFYKILCAVKICLRKTKQKGCDSKSIQMKKMHGWKSRGYSDQSIIYFMLSDTYLILFILVFLLDNKTSSAINFLLTISVKKCFFPPFAILLCKNNEGYLMHHPICSADVTRVKNN